MLRAVARPEIERLLAPLVCIGVDYARLRYNQPDSTDPARAGACIVLLDAALERATLTVHAEAGEWCETSATIRLAVDARGIRHVFEPLVRLTAHDRTILMVNLERHPLAEDDAPAIVTVEATAHDGAESRGRVWLVRPALLALSSDARARRRAVQQMARQAFVAGEDYEVIADAVAALATEVGDLLARGMPAPPQSPSNVLEAIRGSGTAAVVSLDEYIRLSDEDIAAHNTAGGYPRSAPSLLQQLVRASERLFHEPEPEDVEEAGARIGGEIRLQRKETSDVSASESDQGEEEERVDPFAIPALKEAVVRRVASQVHSIAGTALDAPVEARTVEYVLRLLTAVAGVLLRLHLQAALRGNGAARAPLDALRDLFARAISITGTLSGCPRGWLIRAWADPAVRPALKEAFADPLRLARLSAMYGAAFGTSHSQPADDDAALADVEGLARVSSNAHAMVAAGLHLLRVHASAATAGLDDLISDQVSRLAGQSRGRLTVGMLLSALAPPVPDELPIMRSVRRWKPLLKLLQLDAQEVSGRDAAVRALEAADPQMFALYARVRRLPKAVSLRRSGTLWVCNGCHTSIPTQLAAAVEADVGQALTCEGCGRILVPFATDSATSQVVLEALSEGILRSRVNDSAEAREALTDA